MDQTWLKHLKRHGQCWKQIKKRIQMPRQPQPRQPECYEPEQQNANTIEGSSDLVTSDPDRDEIERMETQNDEVENDDSMNEAEENSTPITPSVPNEDAVQNILDLDPLISEEELRAELTSFTGDDAENSQVLIQNGLKRLPCFSHKLQLVVSHFDVFRQKSTASSTTNQRQRERGNRGGTPGFEKIIVKGKKLVAKFNKSCVATTKLVQLTNKKLTADVCTRWSSTYLMLERLVDQKDAIETICKELKWNNLSITEWDMLENICKLLKPFADYTQLMSGSKFITLPLVLPSILELKEHLLGVIKLYLIIFKLHYWLYYMKF